MGRNTHGHRGLDWIGLDWVSQLVDWVGLDLANGLMSTSVTAEYAVETEN